MSVIFLSFLLKKNFFCTSLFGWTMMVLGTEFSKKFGQVLVIYFLDLRSSFLLFISSLLMVFRGHFNVLIFICIWASGLLHLHIKAMYWRRNNSLRATDGLILSGNLICESPTPKKSETSRAQVCSWEALYKITPLCCWLLRADGHFKERKLKTSYVLLENKWLIFRQ